MVLCWLSTDPLAEQTPTVSPYVYVSNNPINSIDPTGMSTEDPPSKGWNRFFGGLKMVGGILETVAGATGGAASSWTGVGGVVGFGVALHGSDVASSGFMQMVTGDNTSSFTSRAIQRTGVSRNTAENIDAGISIVGTAGAGSLTNASKITTATSAYSKIGSTGKVGEDALKLLGGESQVYLKTSEGGRYIDQLVNGVANESKVGYTTLTKSITTQIAKDAEIVKNGTGGVQSSVWHFFKSPVTGQGGASAPLLKELAKNGITPVIH